MGGKEFKSAGEGIVLPKIIHFIWAGGKKIMPAKSVRVVLQWAKANIPDDFSIWLWVDERTYPGGMEQLQNDYGDLFAQEVKKVDFNQVVDFRNESGPFKLLDIEAEGVVDSIVRYETGKPQPNYGASSDRLRYKILHRYGGCYFDSDVSPSAVKKLGEHFVFSKPLKKHVLAYSTTSQGFENSIGNDAFICSQSNPLMNLILQLVDRNYSRALFKSRIDMAVDEAYFSGAKQYIRAMTMDRTGTRVVREALSSKSENCDIFSLNMLIDVKAGGNTGYWLEDILQKCDNIDAVLEIIKKTINFEARRFRVLKLDEHVKNFKNMITKSNLEFDGDPVAMVIDCANTVSAFKRVSVIQLTLTNRETFDFCRQNNKLLQTFILLNAEHVLYKNAIEAAANWYALSRFDLEKLTLQTLQLIHKNLCVVCRLTFKLVPEIMQQSDTPEYLNNILQNVLILREIVSVCSKAVSSQKYVGFFAAQDVSPLQKMLEKLLTFEGQLYALLHPAVPGEKIAKENKKPT